ncbi:MAG: NRDE family protein [Actinobacteria bacterium]|nr:NRDE family protein [Actinomycetota bacterium]
MCTVVCRWQPAESAAVQMLALRDERAGRAFDEPGAWWPEVATVIGGRDRVAGGTWCASDIETGVTAVVLNRPERRVAEPGARSRGALPLLAAARRSSWLDGLDVNGMASFNLVLAEPQQLQWWSFDGVTVGHNALPPGTYLFKPAGRVIDNIDTRLIAGQARLADDGASRDQVWTDWLVPLDEATPTPDGAGLLVDRELAGGEHYRTVFGQFVASRPGGLRLDYTSEPTRGGPWATRFWGNWSA